MEAFWSALAGGVIGGGAAILAAFIAGKFALRAAQRGVEKSLETLREQELRRQQVLAICLLYGLRGGMSSAPDPESRRQLLTELNKIGALFAASAEVQTHLRRFHSNRSNPNFISLIKAAAAEAGMDISGLSNDDIESVFS